MSALVLGQGIIAVDAEPPEGKWLRWRLGDVSVARVTAADGRVLDLHNVIFPLPGELVWVEGDTFYVHHFDRTTTAYRGEWLASPPPTTGATTGGDDLLCRTPMCGHHAAFHVGSPGSRGQCVKYGCSCSCRAFTPTPPSTGAESRDDR